MELSMRDMVRELRAVLEREELRVICQVVETRGSTPQKAGAWMIVAPDGSQSGTLGGGCVENEVKGKALRRIGKESAELYSFVLDHDYAWADGLICGGRMRILAEPWNGSGRAPYLVRYAELLETGAGFTEAVATDPEVAPWPQALLGARLLFDAQGRLRAATHLGAKTDAELEQFQNECGIRPANLSDRPRPVERNGIAWLPTLPRVRLVIAGAGHVGKAVAELATQADFDVWIVDDRQEYANAERFPDARNILVGPIPETLRTLKYDAHTFALVVTRGHGHDQEALHALAPTTAGYVGLIGSKRKIRMIMEGLGEAGIRPEDIARITAPVGLEIGSQSVPEIAISIVAQLIGVRNLGPKT